MGTDQADNQKLRRIWKNWNAPRRKKNSKLFQYVAAFMYRRYTESFTYKRLISDVYTNTAKGNTVGAINAFAFNDFMSPLVKKKLGGSFL